jgi:predicted MFS family arabinose efflux permease
VRVFARLFRLIWGRDVDPALHPVLGVSLAGSTAGAAAWVFIGIWAKKHLGASDTQIGIAFLAGALLAGLSAYAGGHISDYVGRRPVILAGWGGELATLIGFLAVGTNTTLGLVFAAVAPAMGAVGHAADTAIVADLVPPERREASYAAVRVASNLGVALGPPIGGALLLFDSWRLFFAGTSLLAAAAFAVAWRFIPRGGLYAPEEPPRRRSFSVIRRDRAFLVFLASSVLAAMTYVAFETLLPISLVSSYGLDPALWGFMVIVNPLLVTFVQLRLIRWTAGVPAAVKLAVAMPLMGLPFLLLEVSAAVPVVLVVILVFVIGEMLWIPTSQAAVAAFAPADIRGAYMGVFGSSWSIAWALGPFLGLQVRTTWGDSVMWASVAAVSVAAGIFGAAAIRGRRAVPPEAVASAA